MLDGEWSAKLKQRECLESAGHFLLKAGKVNPQAPGLLRTPERYAKAMSYLVSGYEQTPKFVVGEGVFPAESAGLVAVKDIEFYSLCEHHLLPFWGKVSVAYYPNDKIVGLSKIPRIVDVYARRFQVQERLTEEVALGLWQLINPRAVVVKASAQHFCMMMRGVQKQMSSTTTETHKGFENLGELERNRLLSAVDGA